jgi:thymidine kinase
MMDSRYKVSEIITHSGWRQKAHLIETGGDLAYWYNKVKHNTDILAIDEAFMIPEIGQVLIDLYKSGKTVLVSSLDLSANCNAFPEMEKIMPYATKIVKCSAVCSVCGSDAYYTHRKDGDNTEIAVGGSEMYEPRCFQHHMISLM